MTERSNPRAVPASLDAPSPRSPDPPSSPGTGYMPERELPALILFSRGQHTTSYRSVLLRTVYVGESQGASYTMFEAHDLAHRKPVVTIARGSDILARLEIHDIRASMLSIRGGPRVRLREWLHAQKTDRYSFPVGETRYEWRQTTRSLSARLELYAPGFLEPIAFSRHGNVVFEAEDELNASALRLGATRSSQREPYAILSLHAGTPEDVLPTASLWLTPTAVAMQDTVVFSYLLLERATLGTLQD